MQHNDLLPHYLRLYYTPGIGIKRFQKIVNGPYDLPSFFASPELQKALGIPAEVQHALKQSYADQIETDLKWANKDHHHIICITDQNYPEQLKAIENPPCILYTIGEIKYLNYNQLAIVGSRSASQLGLKIAKEFAYKLAEYGWVITSGLAQGIDSASHEGALNAQGKTIAVLGSGLNNIYPKNHQMLAKKIIANGVLVSEFPPHTPPLAENFPKRNRIISGLSKGVLVIEAALKSGSLITARNALEQGREVFAVPHHIFHPLAKGCHQLLREGATLIESVDDILTAFNLPLPEEFCNIQNASFLTREPTSPLISKDGFQPETLNKKYVLTLEEKKIFDCLNFSPTKIDEIIEGTGFSNSKVCSILMDLELAGIVRCELDGYSRT